MIHFFPKRLRTHSNFYRMLKMSSVILLKFPKPLEQKYAKKGPGFLNSIATEFVGSHTCQFLE